MKHAITAGLLLALVAPAAIHSDSVLAIAIYGFMAASLGNGAVRQVISRNSFDIPVT